MASSRSVKPLPSYVEGRSVALPRCKKPLKASDQVSRPRRQSAQPPSHCVRAGVAHGRSTRSRRKTRKSAGIKGYSMALLLLLHKYQHNSSDWPATAPRDGRLVLLVQAYKHGFQNLNDGLLLHVKKEISQIVLVASRSSRSN